MVLVLFFALRRPSYGELQEATMTFEQTYPVVLIRDETVYSATNYGQAVFYASEGERVSKGSKIAEVYRWGYNESFFKDLIAVQQQIRDYQENTVWRDVVDTGLNTLNSQIATKLEEVAAAVSGDSATDVIALERGLSELLNQKRNYLKNNVKADDELNRLYASETQLQEKLASWREDVMAEEAGMVSFNLDGHEQTLNPLNMDKLTRKDIENAKSGTSTIAYNKDSTTRALYRLVNNYTWYCVILADDSIKEMKKDEKFMMTFEGYMDRPHEGKIIGTRKPEDGGILYFVEIQEDIGPLISVRNAVTTMKKDYTGIKVSKKALFTEDTVLGIKVVEGNTTEFVPVTVVYEDGTDAIIQAAEEGTTLMAGSKVVLK